MQQFRFGFFVFQLDENYDLFRKQENTKTDQQSIIQKHQSTNGCWVTLEKHNRFLLRANQFENCDNYWNQCRRYQKTNNDDFLPSTHVKHHIAKIV